ncbi:MAG TPA: HTTM domain-containing protein [Herpetosiphonaceae bacterium]
MPLAALSRLLLRRIDARYVAVTRMVIGLCMLLKSLDLPRLLSLLLRPESLRLPYALPLPELPAAWIDGFTTTWIVLSIMLMLGALTKLVNLALAGMIGYLLLLDQQTYTNNNYALTLWVVLLLLADSGAAVSVDALLRRPKAFIAAWPTELLKLQLTIVYIYSVLAKLNASYLSGGVLVTYLRDDLPPVAYAPGVVVALSLIGLAAEAWLAVGLWLPRLRLLTALGGTAFHITLTLTIGPAVSLRYLDLGIFTLMMIAAYIPFFAPAAPEPAPAPVAAAEPA